MAGLAAVFLNSSSSVSAGCSSRRLPLRQGVRGGELEGWELAQASWKLLA